MGLVSGEELIHMQVDKYLSVNLPCSIFVCVWGGGGVERGSGVELIHLKVVDKYVYMCNLALQYIYIFCVCVGGGGGLVSGEELIP